MRYASGQAFLDAPNKTIAFVGMSGTGKTTLGQRFDRERWFNYSVDYRIGTWHLSEAIHDDLTALAAQEPTLRDLLRSDSIYIRNNITPHNLAALSRYIGKLGNPAQGGRALADFRERQARHAAAERAALMDIPRFIERAQRLYGYPHFLVDAGGSLCEVMDFAALDRCPIYQLLAEQVLVVNLVPDSAMMETLIARQLAYPKPMYYRPAFLDAAIEAFLAETQLAEIDLADCDAFVRFVIPRLAESRAPRYQILGERLGVNLPLAEIAGLSDGDAILGRIAQAIDAKVAAG